jgi:hypothetical protein
MKKVIAFAAIIFCCSMTTVMAQGGGGGQQMTPEQRTAMMKERYKTLGLNDVQTDSVIAISADLRALRPTRETPEDQREAKTKEFNAAMQKRLDKAIGVELSKKVLDAMSQQRPGGRPGGGGKK